MPSPGKLSQLMDLDMLQDKTPEEIAEIWIKVRHDARYAVKSHSAKPHACAAGRMHCARQKCSVAGLGACTPQQAAACARCAACSCCRCVRAEQRVACPCLCASVPRGSGRLRAGGRSDEQRGVQHLCGQSQVQVRPPPPALTMPAHLPVASARASCPCPAWPAPRALCTYLMACIATSCWVSSPTSHRLQA